NCAAGLAFDSFDFRAGFDLNAGFERGVKKTVDNRLPAAIEIEHAFGESQLQLPDGRAGAHQVGRVGVGRNAHGGEQKVLDFAVRDVAIEPFAQADAHQDFRIELCQ